MIIPARDVSQTKRKWMDLLEPSQDIHKLCNRPPQPRPQNYPTGPAWCRCSPSPSRSSAASGAGSGTFEPTAPDVDPHCYSTSCSSASRSWTRRRRRSARTGQPCPRIHSILFYSFWSSRRRPPARPAGQPWHSQRSQKERGSRSCFSVSSSAKCCLRAGAWRAVHCPGVLLSGVIRWHIWSRHLLAQKKSKSN